nr:hypothetical protein [Tanacetum cinerariifolium]
HTPGGGLALDADETKSPTNLNGESGGLFVRPHTPGGGLALDADETKSPTNLNGESGGVFYNCFYCNKKGHIFKSCPAKIKDEVEHAQGHPVEIVEGNIEVNNTTQAKITQNKNMVLCFKFHEYGHFANMCLSKKQGQPKVSLKYLEFIHFKTRGIIKGTYKEKLEGQKKLLFTYGMGEVLIKDGRNGYLIPGVHYAPEITLNILSINLVKQQVRAPEDLTKVEEDSESLKPYQWNIGKTCAVEKGKEKQEHFGIKLEKEEDCKIQKSTHYANEQDKNKGYTGPSTSRISDKEESYGSTSDVYFIII